MMKLITHLKKTLLFLAAFLLIAAGSGLQAQVAKNFMARKTVTVNGDFRIIGNTNLKPADPAATSNNNTDMVYVDTDTDNATWNSSSATLQFYKENGDVLSNPTITHAGLYWTGRTQAGSDPYTLTVGAETYDQTNNQTKNGYTLAITSQNYDPGIGRWDGRIATYTFTPDNGGASVVFEYRSYIGLFSGDNGSVTVRVGNGSSSSVSGSLTSTSNDNYTFTFNAPYVINTGTETIKVKSLRKHRTNNNITTDFRANITYEGKTMDKRQLKFKHSGGTYTTQTAANNNIYYPNPPTGYGQMYSAYADVTGIVQTHGAGEYFVADMALNEGNGGDPGYYGGWGLIVVYENTDMHSRTINIYDGHAYTASNATGPYEIGPLSFSTPQNGPIGVKLGIIAGEGDRNKTGDYLEIQKGSTTQYQRLSNTGNPVNNFFNSSILGTTANDKIGMDIAMFDIANTDKSIIGNNQNSTKFRYGNATTTGDSYIISCIALAFDNSNFWKGTTTSTDWNTPTNWTGGEVPAEGADIVFATALNNNNSPAVNDLVLDINRIVGSVTNGTADKKLIIPVKKTLIINGKANTGTADQLVIKSERGKGNGAIVFGNPGINTSVPATVEFASKSQKVNPGVITQYEWQYIGSPVQGATPQNVFGPNVTGSKYGPDNHVLIRKYSEPKHDTSDVGDKWIDVDVNLPMDNFAGYEVVQPDLTAPTYQFKGNLKVGDFSTGELGFTSGAYFRGNYILANSYAAPIRIDKLKATDFYNLEETIYLFNTGSREQWIAGSGWSTGNGQSTVIGTYYTIPRELAHTLGVKQIPSMNGFLVRRLKNAEAGYVSGDSIRFDFRYASLEKTLDGLGTTTPMFVKGVSSTPGATDGESAKKYPLLKIDVVNGTKADRVMLITAPNTTKKFDNGWDGYKMLASGETQIYSFENGTNRFQVNTDSNLDGTILGIYNGSNGTEFKLDFYMGEDMQGVYDVLNIEDLQTGTITDITDGGSYTFTVNSSSPEGRFRINATPRGDTPTDLNNPIKLFYYKNNDVVVINGSDESGALRIYDIAGKFVQEIPITSGQTSKKLKLRNGIYIFDVRTASYNSTHKIIVQ